MMAGQVEVGAGNPGAGPAGAAAPLSAVGGVVPPRLSMMGITKRFGETLALDAVDFEVLPGEIHALVGQNGAGKSTLMKIVAGDYRPDRGRLLIDGREVEIRDPRQGLAAGVGIVYQELSLLPNLTIAENVSLGREQSRLGFVLRREARRAAREALASMGVDSIDVGTRVGRLSLAEQQLVEIAEVMSHGPKVLVLDEPTAALSLDDARRLFAALRRLRANKVGIVFVSHRYGEVLELCDRCTVLRNGRVVAREPVPTMTLERLVQHTLGEPRARSRRPTAVGGGPRRAAPAVTDQPRLLEVEHLAVGRTVIDVSFSVQRGEVVGLCGLLGSGQSEVARALYGDAVDVEGTVRLDGRPTRLDSPRAAARQGIAFITENRRDEGIFPDLGVVPNVTAASLHQSWRSRVTPWLSPRRERDRVRRTTDEVGVPREAEERKLRLLSGGTQQKVVVSRWLAKGARLLVCNEPTRGVDVGARADIYDQLRALADEGTGILVVTTDIEEALVLCDRVLVCFSGRVTAEIDPRRATEETLFLSMQGLNGEEGRRGG
jgi:ribose transport system ATP-binding protein